MLQAKIASVEVQMRAKLAEVRATHSHAGSKGEQVEDVLRCFLREYLPRRLEVGHGEVIDSYGNRSSQTDVVIVNDDHPFTFTHDLSGLFFIEGVCAAGEVKTVLTSKELTNTMEKARRFKTLRVRRAKGTLICANISDRDRFYTKPPYFLFAFESQISLDTIENELSLAGHHGTDGYTGGIDGVFLLDRGWMIDFGDGKGQLQFRKPDGEAVRGWVLQKFSCVLFDFLGWLSSVILRSVRFEAILPRYLVEEWQ